MLLKVRHHAPPSKQQQFGLRHDESTVNTEQNGCALKQCLGEVVGRRGGAPTTTTTTTTTTATTTTTTTIHGLRSVDAIASLFGECLRRS